MTDQTQQIPKYNNIFINWTQIVKNFRNNISGYCISGINKVKREREFTLIVKVKWFNPCLLLYFLIDFEQSVIFDFSRFTSLSTFKFLKTLCLLVLQLQKLYFPQELQFLEMNIYMLQQRFWLIRSWRLVTFWAEPNIIKILIWSTK